MSDEALRLLAEARDDMLTWHGRCPIVDRIDAFLAQPTAAREAVLVEALKALEWVGPTDQWGLGKTCIRCGAWKESGVHQEGCPIALTLADPSPAAAALLARVEGLEEALEECGAVMAEAVVLVASRQPPREEHPLYIRGEAAQLKARAALAPACVTCGGTRVAPVSDEDLGGKGITMSSCPDCAGEPIT